MKYIFLSVILLTITGSAFTQQSPAEEIAAKIANRMKDSLQLTTTIREQVYNANLQLHDRKMSMWQQFRNSPDTLTRMIQHIENSRDSIYKQIIGEEKFSAYFLRKKAIINNN
ncbi:MAG: hypothetical protein BGO52_00590 [Sphingobacteriales bacterium 44-61]|uniref:hypothetical protein n=1 Tax=uncultured Dysgonomonas sp. TaxID=206096 RepID=UPI00095E2938|nr:hypothetical protein [uncultured Dysgonomonas sp.]OJW02645.1 MAG: hypothetical protein BGO52_00590 [Sphingobacteriales bacterium 44-61]